MIIIIKNFLRRIYRFIQRICINFLVKLSITIYFLTNKKNEDDNKLKELKDIHKDKRAFIICNGPSLNIDDLNTLQLNGEISFAANLITPMIETSNWTPTYYSVTDPIGVYKLISTMNAVKAEVKFLPRDSYITGMYVTGNVVFFNRNGDRKLLDNPRFSDDCSKIVYSIATVTYTSIQLAAYMGIKEMYIIGCDHRFARQYRLDGTIEEYCDQKNYFSGVKEKYQRGASNIGEQAIAFDAAKKYADEHGIKIYNATRGGYLEVFERVDFDSLFKK